MCVWGVGVCVVSGCVECMWGVSVCGKCAIVWRVYEFGECMSLVSG